MNAPFNKHGGLTLVPLPGFEAAAARVARHIEERGAREGERVTPVDVATPSFNLRPSGETFVQLESKHIGEHDCVVIGSGPGTDKMVMDLLWTLSYMSGRKAARVLVITGYFPLCRSDKDEGDKELTMPPMLVQLAKAACGPKGLYRWVCADPHSEQIAMAGRPGLVTPVYLTRRLLKKVIDMAVDPTKLCLAFPDDSARKRYDPAREAIEKELGLTFPDIIALKRRVSAKKTKIVDIVGRREDVEGRVVAMIDDEIATAGSMMDFGQVLRGYGADDVWAAATHAVCCGKAAERFTADDCPVTKIIVTDTIPLPQGGPLEVLRDQGRLTQLSWLEDMAWVIYTHHWGGNLRTMR